MEEPALEVPHETVHGREVYAHHYYADEGAHDDTHLEGEVHVAPLYEERDRLRMSREMKYEIDADGHVHMFEEVPLSRFGHHSVFLS